MENNSKKIFPKVYENEIKEIFSKERKYDSFYDEHKRIVQFGKTFNLINIKKEKEFFNNTIIYAFKGSGIKINEEDLFSGHVIKNKNKKNRIDNFKVVDYTIDKNGYSVKIQYLTKILEIRTSIKLEKRKLVFSKNKWKVSFIQFFKKETPFFGFKDSVLKNVLKKDFKKNCKILKEYFISKKHIK